MHDARTRDLTADELEAVERLALAADPEAPLPDDAIPWTGQDGPAALLPDWYMPAPAGSSLRGWRRGVAWLLVAASLAVVASGLCNTYGELVIA